MITPFGDDDRIDAEALANEAVFLKNCRVNGIVVAGSMGEGAGMSPDEVGMAVHAVVEAVDGSIPVLAGIIADTSREAVRLSVSARSAGASGLQVPPPNFAPSTDVRVLSAYYRSIAEASGLPLIIYNVIPWAQVAVESLHQLVSEIRGITGVKQSGRNIHALSALLAFFRGKLRVYSAIDDMVFPSFVLGADGTISGTACVFPAETVQMREAVENGDYATAREIHERLSPVWREIDHPDFPSRAKYAVSLTGRPAGRPRLPLQWPNGDAAASIEQALIRGGLRAGALSERGIA
jgi:4-hydroxy-tetrahydrodipicolinate synthase